MDRQKLISAVGLACLAFLPLFGCAGTEVDPEPVANTSEELSAELKVCKHNPRAVWCEGNMLWRCRNKQMIDRTTCGAYNPNEVCDPDLGMCVLVSTDPPPPAD